MKLRIVVQIAAASAFAALLSGTGAEAAMSPVTHFSDASVQHVDCAVGFHIGPAGACIIGAPEEHHDVVMEHRGATEGCQTKSVQRSDDMGNSETRTRTNCD